MTNPDSAAFFGEQPPAIDPIVTALLQALYAFRGIPLWYQKLAVVSAYEFLEAGEMLPTETVIPGDVLEN